METIHFKTVDPVSQDLLRGASQKGIGLNWERYEKQQPQDGFLRLGLSCPYGCMQGPCRIDPYGRGADSGICGLDRDGMAAAFLLRLALQGVLETMDRASGRDAATEIAWPAPLDKKASAALKQFGGVPLSLQEISESAAMLSRPGPPRRRRPSSARRCVWGFSASACGNSSGPTIRRIDGDAASDTASWPARRS